MYMYVYMYMQPSLKVIPRAAQAGVSLVVNRNKEERDIEDKLGHILATLFVISYSQTSGT